MVRFLLRALLALGLVAAALPVGLHLLAHLRERAGTAEAAPAAGRLVPTAMGAIYVEEAGPAEGPAVLLIHGSVGWAGLWRETMAALAAAGYRAIAFDMPPMGFSERDPEDDYARTTQARRVVALSEALGVRPVIAAHSFGAGAGAEAAMRAPGAFAGLVVISVAVGLGSHEGAGAPPAWLRPQALRELAVAATVTNPWATGPLLRRFVHRKEAVGPEHVALLHAPLRREGSTRALAVWSTTLLVPPADALSTRPEGWAGLALPAAFVWGDRDTTTPLAQGEALAALVPGAPLAVLAGVGHIPQIEAPGAFHRALLDALATLARAD